MRLDHPEKACMINDGGISRRRPGETFIDAWQASQMLRRREHASVQGHESAALAELLLLDHTDPVSQCCSPAFTNWSPARLALQIEP